MRVQIKTVIIKMPSKLITITALIAAVTTGVNIDSSAEWFGDVVQPVPDGTQSPNNAVAGCVERNG